MKKYLALYSLSFRDVFSDAGKTFVWILVGAAHSFGLAFIWILVADGQDTVGSMATSAVVTYYFYRFILWYIVGGTFNPMMEDSIRQGKLSQWLLKPVFPFSHDVLYEQGWKSTGFLLGLPTLFAFALLFWQYLDFSVDIRQFLFSLPAVFLGIFAFMGVQYIMGLSSFWTDKTEGIRSVEYSLSDVLGAGIAPMILMPDIIQKIAFFLPFRYSFSFPLEIFQGQIQGNAIVHGYIMQVLWIFLMLGVCFFLQRRGLYKYEAFGN